MEWSPAEVADLGEVAAWAALQPWSNGRVGAFGISYGNTAELAAVSNQPAIRAIMPLYDSFDVLSTIQAGGVAVDGLLKQWSDTVAALDRDDVCGADQVTGWSCWKDRLMAVASPLGIAVQYPEQKSTGLSRRRMTGGEGIEPISVDLLNI